MTADAAPRLPLHTRVLFASASFGGEAVSQSRGLWLLFFYAPPPDADAEQILPLGLVGALLFAGRLIEAFNDPLIAYWSDRTRSRLGRRLPFVIAATPFWALFAFLLFVPPPFDGWRAAVWFLLVLELMFLFATMTGGPYEALLPEIARTSRDRLSIVGVRVYFGAGGAALGIVVSGAIIELAGFPGMAGTMALVLLLTRYAGVVGVWNHVSRTQEPAKIGLREAVLATVRNEQFLYFLPTFVLFQTGLQMLLGVLPFQVTVVLGAGREGTWVSILTGVALGTAVAVVPLFVRYARRTSKARAYSRAMLGAGLLFPLLAFAGFLPFVRPEVQMIAILVLVGVPLVAVFLFPAALIADIVDYDEIRTGLRREAMYFGTQNFVEKTTTAFAPLLVSTILLLGRTEDDPLGVRLIGPVAGGLVLLGWAVFRRYDLPDEVPPPEPEPT